MAEVMPVIAGLMACMRCLAVRAFTVATDFERNGGKSWEICPVCGRSGWFYPFVLPPSPTPETET